MTKKKKTFDFFMLHTHVSFGRNINLPLYIKHKFSFLNSMKRHILILRKSLVMLSSLYYISRQIKTLYYTSYTYLEFHIKSNQININIFLIIYSNI